MILPEPIIHMTLQNTATQNKTFTKMIFLPFTLGPSYMWSRLWDKYQVWVLRAGTSWDPFSSWVNGYLQYPESSHLGTIAILTKCAPPPFYVSMRSLPSDTNIQNQSKQRCAILWPLNQHWHKYRKARFMLFEVERLFRMLVYFGNKFYVNYMVHNVFSKQITSMWIIANTSKIENYTLAMSFNMWLP